METKKFYLCDGDKYNMAVTSEVMEINQIARAVIVIKKAVPVSIRRMCLMR